MLKLQVSADSLQMKADSPQIHLVLAKSGFAKSQHRFVTS